MRTKNEIIAELYGSKEFNDCIAKMEPEHLRDDLKAEVVLILLETSEERIQALYERKDGLRFYTVRIILNLIQSSTSKFYKLYRQQMLEITDRIPYQEEDFEERAVKEAVEDKAMKEVDNLYWYNEGLVRLYLQHGNYRAIEKDTGIPYSSAYKTIQRSFQEIKQKVLG